ncbi:MAG TPA: hypothetical protein VL003_02695 [Pusillimonas sp.]|uniref:hypothetical protein n=1 Tax=Pusillimonas sp. TaxID=3040095 RepID=UPI002CC5A29C|nr:hypothetical protein [Pusillimonas sp.]HUH86942.1 hypothetical protein [Pusillimonas sp.]
MHNAAKTGFAVWLLLIGFYIGPAAGQTLCDAPFMHDQGRVKLDGTGALRLGADLSFSEVRKSGPGQCQARVRGNATFGLGGLPGGKSDLDYWITLRDGQTTFERLNAQGGREPVDGKFDLRMLGLFSYGQPINRVGQTFPARKFQINVDHKGVDAKPVVVHTGAKTVGHKADIQTAAGTQSCWPISYSRVVEATQASFSGLVLPIPEIRSSVTDWFCPELNMVMKQESRQQGVPSVVEVSELK